MVSFRRILMTTMVVLPAAQAGLISSMAKNLITLSVEKTLTLSLRPSLPAITSNIRNKFSNEILPKIVTAAIEDVSAQSGTDVSTKVNKDSLIKSQAGEVDRAVKDVGKVIEDGFVRGVRESDVVNTLMSVTDGWDSNQLNSTVFGQVKKGVEGSVETAVGAWYNSTVMSIYDRVCNQIATTQGLKKALPTRRNGETLVARAIPDKILDVLNVITMLGVYTLFIPIGIIMVPLSLLVELITGIVRH